MRHVIYLNSMGKLRSNMTDGFEVLCSETVNPQLYKILRYSICKFKTTYRNEECEITVIDSPALDFYTPVIKTIRMYDEEKFKNLLEIYKENIDMKPINQILSENIKVFGK